MNSEKQLMREKVSVSSIKGNLDILFKGFNYIR